MKAGAAAADFNHHCHHYKNSDDGVYSDRKMACESVCE